MANAVHIEEAQATNVPYIDIDGLKAFNKDKAKIKKLLTFPDLNFHITIFMFPKQSLGTYCFYSVSYYYYYYYSYSPVLFCPEVFSEPVHGIDMKPF